MSLHWVVLHRTAFGSKKVDFKAILKELIAREPSAAPRFAAVNWQKLTEETATRAVQEVAKDLGKRSLKEYPNRTSYESGDSVPEGHTCLAVISDGQAHLAVATDANGALCFYENGYSRERHSATLQEWRKAIEHKFATLGMDAILKLRGITTKVKTENGVTTIVGVLPKKKGQP